MVLILGGLAILALVGAMLALIPGGQQKDRVPGEQTVTAIAVVVAGIALLMAFLVFAAFFV